MLLFRAAVVEVVAIAVAFVCAAGGHGNYVAAKILFPYSLALTHFTHVITRPLVALALAQYPAYALAFLGVGPGRQSRIRWIVLVYAWCRGLGSIPACGQHFHAVEVGAFAREVRR